MMLPAILHDAVSAMLSKFSGSEQRIENLMPLSGGSINEAFMIETVDGKYFLKYNRASAYPGMFEQEAKGLKILYDAGEIRVPELIGFDETSEYTYLVLEYLGSAGRKQNFWEDFGRKLASLHRHTNDYFGLDHDNYIGSLKQYNKRHESWRQFFIEERLMVQMEMAGHSGLLSSSMQQAFERLFESLDSIFPDEPPALIHGDLWSGNFMVDEKGQACVIDPAVYYGCREMDIGMSRLFGVFGTEFYQAYNEAYPMEAGWHERIEICNLYPLMVHVNLFGAGYLASVQSILSRF